LELVSIEDKVPGKIYSYYFGLKIYQGLITRKGLLKWPVCETKTTKDMEEENKTEEDKTNPNTFFNIYESVDQLPKDYTGLLRATMFPDTEERMRDVIKIQNTVRLMPHDQNTGGFYLALIRKKNHVVFGSGKSTENKASKKETKEQTMNVEVQENQEVEAIKEVGKDIDEKEALKLAVAEEETKVEAVPEKKEKQEKMQVEEGYKSPKEKEKKKKEKKETFVTLDNKDWESIRDYYGLDEKLKDLLIQQTPGEKKVYLISPGIRKVLDLDKAKGNFMRLFLCLNL